MAYHRPDHKLVQANDLLKSMKGEKELPTYMKDITQEEKDDLILYLIKSKDEYIKSQNERLQEYQGVFNAIGKFIPHKGPTVYG
jgi:hypothetical protein